MIAPAAWPVSDGPRVARQMEVEWDAASSEAFTVASALRGSTRLMSGASDAADHTRFTVPFVFNGVPGTWEFRLGNDNRVTHVVWLEPQLTER